MNIFFLLNNSYTYLKSVNAKAQTRNGITKVKIQIGWVVGKNDWQ